MIARILRTPVEDWLGVAFMLALLILMGINVFARYVLNTGIVWSEEISRYLLVWMVYIGIASGIRTQSHIRVDLIDRLVGPRTRRILAILNTILLFLFLATLCWLFVQLVGRFARLRSPASGLSMAYAYGAVLFGAGLGLLRLAITYIVGPRPWERP